MVVVEGPDGAGKTTLVRDLIDRFDLAPAAHTQLSQAERNRLRERNQKEFVYSALAEAVQAHGPIRVHDRMYFSHLVYQPIVDNKPVQFTEREKRMIRLVLAALHVPVILCRPPFETVLENVQKSEKGQQMTGVEEKIKEIYDAYSLVGESGAHGNPLLHTVSWYDYTETFSGQGSYRTLSQVYEMVENYMKFRTERMW